MSEKIKGSDGINRTLGEWCEYIEQRAALCHGEGKLEAKSQSVKDSFFAICRRYDGHTLTDMPEDEETNQAGLNAARFFISAMRDAIARHDSYEDRTKAMASHLKALSNTIAKEGYKFDKVATLGSELSLYIKTHDAMPPDINTLLDFINQRGINKIGKSTAYDALEWYELQDVIRSYGRG